MRILPGYFGGENCISNEYRPTNLLTCSTDMGLLRLCKISEMPQLGWECPGVSYWVWQNFKREKKKKKRESGGGGGGGGGETDGEEGRRVEQNKNNEKKIKTLICCNLLSKLWCPIFPHPGCPFWLCGNMFYMFTGTSFYWLGSFRQWPGWMKGF